MADSTAPGSPLGTVRQSTYECLRCAFCFDVSWVGAAGSHLCPSYTWGSFESYSARGRIALARAILEGELDYGPSLIERFFACTECRACGELCFKYIDTVRIFAAVRQELAARGLAPAQLAATAEELARTHNLYGQPHGQRLAWLKDHAAVNRPADVAFFVGCTPSYVRRTLARDTLAVLEAAGLHPALLDDEWCCGHPFLAAGEPQRAAEVMHHNLEVLQRLGVQRVVFQCPGCLHTFRKELPHLLGQPLPFEAVHVVEEVAHQVESGRLRFAVYQPGTVVTYHDPCSLGRGLGIYDAPRAVIAAMPGMRLQEMPRHGRDAYCCGAGSFVRYDYSSLADQTGAERFHEAEATGAHLLLTACPACATQLQHTRSQVGGALPVMDLVSLVRELARWN